MYCGHQLDVVKGAKQVDALHHRVYRNCVCIHFILMKKKLSDRKKQTKKKYREKKETNKKGKENGLKSKWIEIKIAYYEQARPLELE